MYAIAYYTLFKCTENRGQSSFTVSDIFKNTVRIAVQTLHKETLSTTLFVNSSAFAYNLHQRALEKYLQ